MTKREWALLVATMDHGACKCDLCLRAARVGSTYGPRLLAAQRAASRRVKAARRCGDAAALPALVEAARLLTEARGSKSRVRR
ncbi:MAG TPA: hypothetical protein VFT36_00365 [Methylomirabilota bacterium]|nr:hypothetical protein [Methylomirabilota bacterium]